MSLKHYLEYRNLQRKIESQTKNYLRGIAPPITLEK
jgi:hypothetical protein